jgi:hypothetical protein
MRSQEEERKEQSDDQGTCFAFLSSSTAGGQHG